MTSLTGKVAIVTGASRGIGRLIAQRLSEDGATVVINYGHSASEAKEFVAAIESSSGKALAVQADMSQVADIRRLFEETINQFGGLDILVNNAGVGKGGLIAETSEEDFDAAFGLNTRGTFFALQEAARRMRDGGRIINISSTTTLFTNPGFAVYAASKITLKIFADVLAQEVGSRGITVNNVLPGPTSPGMFDHRPESEQQAAATSSPFGRIGKAEDIADVVAFLASESARWITGQEIVANGGAKI